MGGEIRASRAERDRKALEEFLVGNGDLERLEVLLGQFNVFETIGVVRQELRHSDFLAFLFDPRGSHGLGDTFVKRLLQWVLMAAGGAPVPVTPIELELCGTWAGWRSGGGREWRHIDVLSLDGEHELAVVVENKIGSKEHGDQLQRYLETVGRDSWEAPPRLAGDRSVPHAGRGRSLPWGLPAGRLWPGLRRPRQGPRPLGLGPCRGREGRDEPLHRDAEEARRGRLRDRKALPTDLPQAQAGPGPHLSPPPRPEGGDSGPPRRTDRRHRRPGVHGQAQERLRPVPSPPLGGDPGLQRRAIGRYEESLALFREIGHGWGSAFALSNLAVAALGRGEIERALALGEESFSVYRELWATGRVWRWH